MSLFDLKIKLTDIELYKPEGICSTKGAGCLQRCVICNAYPLRTLSHVTCYISMVWFKTAVTPLLSRGSYSSLALNNRYNRGLTIIEFEIKHFRKCSWLAHIWLINIINNVSDIAHGVITNIVAYFAFKSINHYSFSYLTIQGPPSENACRTRGTLCLKWRIRSHLKLKDIFSTP